MEGLEGLGADVTTAMINGLLLARAPRILDAGSEEYSQLVDLVRGAVSEVVPIVGLDPPEGLRRDLAVRAVAYLAAAELESALFPEQQSPGDQGRASFLLGRYNALRGQLISMPDPSGGESVSPRGNFPPADRYPDPADRPGARTCGW